MACRARSRGGRRRSTGRRRRGKGPQDAPGTCDRPYGQGSVAGQQEASSTPGASVPGTVCFSVGRVAGRGPDSRRNRSPGSGGTSPQGGHGAGGNGHVRPLPDPVRSGRDPSAPVPVVPTSPEQECASDPGRVAVSGASPLTVAHTLGLARSSRPHGRQGPEPGLIEGVVPVNRNHGPVVQHDPDRRFGRCRAGREPQQPPVGQPVAPPRVRPGPPVRPVQDTGRVRLGRKVTSLSGIERCLRHRLSLTASTDGRPERCGNADKMSGAGAIVTATPSARAPAWGRGKACES